MSPAALDHHREYYQRFRDRLQNEVKPDSLSAEDRADFHIMQDQVALALLDYEETQSYLHNPTLYVEMAGNALFTPLTLEYAPLDARIRHIIARLQKLPMLLDQARTNLISSPSIWTKVAVEENEGNIALVDKTIRAAVPANQRADFDRAARAALDALHTFQEFMQSSLAVRDDYDWRLGRDHYTRKFRYALACGSDPSDVLESAAAQPAGGACAHAGSGVAVARRSISPTIPIIRSGRPGAREPGDFGSARPHRATGTPRAPAYVDDARHDLDEARQFVAHKHLVTLPPHANLQVIPTPEFMRGIYARRRFLPGAPARAAAGRVLLDHPDTAEWDRRRASNRSCANTTFTG